MRRDGAPNEQAFHTTDGETFIQLRDSAVLVIEGLPAKHVDRLPKLVSALWKQ
jgi:hypothetical protein